jgi:hypothetical protein
MEEVRGSSPLLLAAHLVMKCSQKLAAEPPERAILVTPLLKEMGS